LAALEREIALLSSYSTPQTWKADSVNQKAGAQPDN
jgi:hypothetical protein